jgi:hypothetical protein
VRQVCRLGNAAGYGLAGSQIGCRVLEPVGCENQSSDVLSGPAKWTTGWVVRLG